MGQMIFNPLLFLMFLKLPACCFISTCDWIVIFWILSDSILKSHDQNIELNYNVCRKKYLFCHQATKEKGIGP